MVLFISCSSETSVDDQTPEDLPKITKLKAEVFNSDGSLNRINTYQYFYQNDVMYKIDIKKEYQDRPKRSRDYTITKTFVGGLVTEENHQHRVNLDQDHVSKINYSHENNLITKAEFIRNSGDMNTDVYTYDANKLIKKENGLRTYTYEYDSQDRLVKSNYSTSTNSSISEYVYDAVLSPFYHVTTNDINKAFVYDKNLRFFNDETFEVETNEFNLPTKVTIKYDGVVRRIRTYQY